MAEIKECIFYYTGDDKGNHLIAGIFDDAKAAVQAARQDFERMCRNVREACPDLQEDPDGSCDHFNCFADYDPVIGGGWNVWDGKDTVFAGSPIPRLCKVGKGVFEPCPC